MFFRRIIVRVRGNAHSCDFREITGEFGSAHAELPGKIPDRAFFVYMITKMTDDTADFLGRIFLRFFGFRVSDKCYALLRKNTRLFQESGIS